MNRRDLGPGLGLPEPARLSWEVTVLGGKSAGRRKRTVQVSGYSIRKNSKENKRARKKKIAANRKAVVNRKAAAGQESCSKPGKPQQTRKAAVNQESRSKQEYRTKEI